MKWTKMNYHTPLLENTVIETNTKRSPEPATDDISQTTEPSESLPEVPSIPESSPAHTHVKQVKHRLAHTHVGQTG